jgi:hypothetical protein
VEGKKRTRTVEVGIESTDWIHAPVRLAPPTGHVTGHVTGGHRAKPPADLVETVMRVWRFPGTRTRKTWLDVCRARVSESASLPRVAVGDSDVDLDPSSAFAASSPRPTPAPARQSRKGVDGYVVSPRGAAGGAAQTAYSSANLIFAHALRTRLECHRARGTQRARFHGRPCSPVPRGCLRCKSDEGRRGGGPD